MTANIQDYNNPNYQNIEREGNPIPNKPQTKRATNQVEKYHCAALTTGRPLAIAKGLTLAKGATEWSDCRQGSNGAEEAWGNNTMLNDNAKNTMQD